MINDKSRTIVVTGATGLQGGAVARHLLSNGWHVRGLTRNLKSEKAQVLTDLGAEVVQGDMDKAESLMPVFEDSYGVFNVQNPVISGVEGEIRQGKNVAEVAQKAGVQHLVYGSAGIGIKGTGVPSWESKLVVEDHIKFLGLPLTVLRPMAFMELMTDKKFFPAVSTWHVMPKLMGNERKVVWLCADDLGFIAAKAFAEPDQFIGRELLLASDIKSIDECRRIYREVMSKNPPRFPMPVWMFERFGFVGKDLGIMWRWLRRTTFDMDTSTALAVHPDALTVKSWLEKQKSQNRKGT
ncbi:MAG: NmrA/HSCARG family protein [Chloroflexi bacterium]|nr:MAG: NmrA/HSCARG family protein [Chloroflexota bacterium]